MRGLRLLLLACVLSALAARGDDSTEARAKQIASGSCFLCHGARGEAASELFPRLAGQNASYLVKQLANFKTGERKSAAMQPMVAALSPEDMRALGRYFAAQKTESHPTADTRLAARGMLVYTRGGAATEVAACVGCHGDKGYGTEGLPRLAGQVPPYLVNQLKNFGTRMRTNDNAVMHTIAARMTEDEMQAVAEYLGGLR